MCLTCQLVIEGSLVSTSHRVGVGIDAAATATLNDGVEDGAALAGIGIAQEQPVLFSKSGRPNGVFHKVIVYLHSAIFEMGVVYQMTSEGRQGRALRRQAAEAGIGRRAARLGRRAILNATTNRSRRSLAE